MMERDMASAQKLEAVFTKLRHVSQKAKEEPELQFTSLAHLLTVELLGEAYRLLRKDASPGVDGQTAGEYEEELGKNLRELHQRLREGRYRAQPVKRVYIEKEDGKKRPLGIPSLEDKIVQKAALLVLESIYERDFLPCSYGFRPGRGAQDALNEVYRAIVFGKVNYVLDADIKGYFDNIVRNQLMEFIQQRVKDRSLLRLISKWLHVGVVEEGRLLPTSKGTPQGAVISPWMANVYLHYVLDQWVEDTVKPRMRGEVYLIRYADDFIGCFQYREDAERFSRVLGKRFAKYGLELSEEKTRLLAFGREAESNWRRSGKDKPGTFDFLGFTHVCARSRKGRFTVQVRTARKRLQRAMRRMTEWCRNNRHLSVAQQRAALNQKLRGHYGYYGRRSNHARLRQFYEHTKKTWHQWLSRRSQRRRLPGPEFAAFLQRCPLLPPRITQAGYVHG